MNRIDAKFAELEGRGESALIPYITAGDPDLKTTLKILRALAQSGADCIELGIPFSDPMADGPTIQRASERALMSGTSLARVLGLVRDFRKFSQIPLILFGYYNPFFHYGTRRLAREAKAAGVDGILCVDLPPEESGEMKCWNDTCRLRSIFLLAPTSDVGRVKLVARAGRGFIYFVSVVGVTGARTRFSENLRTLVARIQRRTSLPVGVGFGVSSPKQAAWISSFANAVIVGSALVGLMEKEKSGAGKVRRAAAFTAALKRAMIEARRDRRCRF